MKSSKLKHHLFWTALGVAVLTGSMGQANDRIPGFAEYFSSQMDRMQGVLSTADAAGPDDGSHLELNRFLFDINPHAGFGLSGVLNLTINPEVHFMWERVTVAAEPRPSLR